MTHPTDEMAAGLVDGTISKEEREQVLNHLDQCEECRAVFAESLKFLQQEERTGILEELPGGANKFRPAKVIPIAASVLIMIASAFFIWQQVSNTPVIAKKGKERE